MSPKLLHLNLPRNRTLATGRDKCKWSLRSRVKEALARLLSNLEVSTIPSAPFIICYHRVLESESNEVLRAEPGMYITSETLELHIRALTRSHQIIPLRHLLGEYFAGRDMTYHCSLTFDDGWADNYYNAYPILLEHRAPASFFLATSFIDAARYPWSYELAAFVSVAPPLVLQRAVRALSLPPKTLGLLNRHYVSVQEKATLLIWVLKNEKTQKEREAFMSMVREFVEGNPDGKPIMMSWKQISEMERSGLFKFSPHGHDHESLTSLSWKEVEEDVAKSLDLIIRNTEGGETDIFCYPSGMHNESVAAVLQRRGVGFALCTQSGTLASTRSKYAVKRMRLHNAVSQTEAMLRLTLARQAWVFKQ